MPKILDRLVKEIMSQGKSESSAYAIATKALQKSGYLVPGTRTATPKGIAKGNAPIPKKKKRKNKKKTK